MGVFTGMMDYFTTRLHRFRQLFPHLVSFFPVLPRLPGHFTYQAYFKSAFNSDSVTLKYIQQAIATFERSVVSHSSRFDQFTPIANWGKPFFIAYGVGDQLKQKLPYHNCIFRRR